MNASRIAAVAALIAGIACDTLKAPEIVPSNVTTAKITTTGAELETTVNAYNPNANALTATGVETKVTIGGKPNVARAVVTDPMTLPPGQRITLKIPIHVEWTDPAAIAALAEAKKPADYVVEGMVQFIGNGKAIQTQLKVTGTMTSAELAQAAKPKP